MKNFTRFITSSVLIVLSAVLFSQKANADTMIQIGTGTTSQNYPFDGYYYKSRTQYLYTAAEMSGLAAGPITKLAFDFTAIAGGALLPLNISMKNVTATALPSGDFSQNSFTTVYSHSYTPVLGFQIFIFDTPFIWDGTSNIIVDICFDNSAWGMHTSVNHTVNATSDKCRYWHADSGAGCGHVGASGLNYRANIRIYQPNNCKGSLTGTITDSITGLPVSGALVTVGSVSAVSNFSGNYTIDSIYCDNYSVQCSKTGYITKTSIATIASKQLTTLNFAMKIISGIVVTVGGSTAYTSPPYLTNYPTARTQLLYTAAEITSAGGIPGTIRQIGFNVNYADPLPMHGFNIRLKNTTLTSLSEWVSSGMTTVYSGTYMVPGTGWQLITFDNPFTYDGTNLLVEICFSNTESSIDTYVYASSMPNMTLYSVDYSGNGCDIVTPYAESNRPNLRFTEWFGQGTLSGSVHDSTHATSMSGVAVIAGTSSTLTNADGFYTISNLSSGPYNVNFSKSGYTPKVVATTILNEQTATLNAVLDSIPTELTGHVWDSYTGLAIAGAVITIGNRSATSGPDGLYRITKLTPGIYPVACTALRYYQQNIIDTLVFQQATIQDFYLHTIPARLNGVVTNAANGNPIIGALVYTNWSCGNLIAFTTAGGNFEIPPSDCAGYVTLNVLKDGYDTYQSAPVLVQFDSTTTVAIQMLENLNPPAFMSAELNSQQNAVNLTWGVPKGFYEIIYDDGVEDNFAVWPASGNMHAVKFTPQGYPAWVGGGRLNIGDYSDYPNYAGMLDPFVVGVFDDSGPNGTPGVMISSDTVSDVYPGTWNYLDFPWAQINSGSFYLVMIQGGTPPHAAGIAIDASANQFRSYSRNVSGGGSWVPAAGNYMLRAIVYGTGGPLKVEGGNSQAPVTAGAVPGLTYSQSPLTRSGVEGHGKFKAPSGTFAKSNRALPEAALTQAGISSPGNGPATGGGTLQYKLFRLKQGQENAESLWTDLGITTQVSKDDSAWPSLPDGPYRWAVKTIFAGNRYSTPTLSNFVGKNWTTRVTVDVSTACSDLPKTGTLVTLDQPPVSTRSAVLDTSGIAVFQDVWKGNTAITIIHPGAEPYIHDTLLMDTLAINFTLYEMKPAPTTLTVNDRSLALTWNAVKLGGLIFNEDWASAGFTANGWSNPSGKWTVPSTVGNPAPCAQLYWADVPNYDYSLISKTFTGNTLANLALQYDIFLSDYASDGNEMLDVEIQHGSGSWVNLAHYVNLGSIQWTNQIIDISAYTNTTFRIRYHAHGANLFNINFWNIDNIKLISSTDSVTPLACFLGYKVFLNGVLNGTTMDTTYSIPIGDVQYGTTYDACVKAAYTNGMTPSICKTFTARFLCPPTELAGTAVDSVAHLTWLAPNCIFGHLVDYILDQGMLTYGYSCSGSPVIEGFGNYFPIAAGISGRIKSFDIYTFATVNMNGAVTYQMDMYDLSGNLLGTSAPFVPAGSVAGGSGWNTVTMPDVPFNGPFYGCFRYNLTNSSWSGCALAYDTMYSIHHNNVGGYFEGSPWYWSLNSASGGKKGAFVIRATADVNDKKKDMLTGGDAPQGSVLTKQLAQVVNNYLDPKTTMAPANVPPLHKGYTIWRDGSQIAYLPDNLILQYDDHTPEPGTFSYEVKAFYDVSPVAPLFDNSLPAGPVDVNISYGYPLPFIEPWDMGTFSYQKWGPVDQWSVTSGTGNPAPSAVFIKATGVTPYSSALISPFINATAWTCAKIWFDFDFKRICDLTSDEKLFAEVYFDHRWIRVGEFDNAGTAQWASKHLDITFVKSNFFRVRFLASGDTTNSLLQWYVDNINVYGTCIPPTKLAGDTTNTNSVSLSWEAPNCLGGQRFQIVLDDGGWDNGWRGYSNIPVWYGNLFQLTAGSTGYLTSFDVYFLQYSNSIVKTMTIDVFDIAGKLLGSSSPFLMHNSEFQNVEVPIIPITGSFYGMVHWDASASTIPYSNYLGQDMNGPYAVYDLGVHYDGMTFQSMGNFNGNPGSFMIRANGVANSGKSRQPLSFIEGKSPLPAGIPGPASSDQKVSGNGDSQSRNPLGLTFANSPARTSLTGYNIYRTDATGLSQFTKINQSLVYDTTYLDVNVPYNNPGATYKYYVTFNLFDQAANTYLCESSSDTIEIGVYRIGYVINGIVKYNNNNNNPLYNIHLYLLEGDNVVDSVTTDANGHFAFLPHPNGTYNITFYSNGNWGGVNGTDAIKIQRHFAGIESITEPVRLQAADVNLSNSINATDAIKVKRRFAGLDDSFARGDWTFAKPITGGDTVTLNGVSVTQDFYGLCVGDVNGSHVPVAPYKSSASVISLIAAGELGVRPGEIITIPIRIARNLQLGAVSMVVKYPAELLEVKNVSIPASGLIYNITGDEIRLVWSELQPINLNTGDVILTLECKVKDTFVPGKTAMLELTDESELADAGGIPIPKVDLITPLLKSSDKPGSSGADILESLMVFPNPTDKLFNLGFTLNESAAIKIELLSIYGQLLQTNDYQENDPGNCLHQIDVSYLSQGVYFINVKAEGKNSVYSKTFRVIIKK